MNILRLLEIKCSETDKVKMILSNNADIGSDKGIMISVKAFAKLTDELIEWKNNLIKQNKEKPCAECKWEDSLSVCCKFSPCYDCRKDRFEIKLEE